MYFTVCIKLYALYTFCMYHIVGDMYPTKPAITATDLLMKISLNLTCIGADQIFQIQDNPENSKSFGGNTNFGVVALD